MLLALSFMEPGEGVSRRVSYLAARQELKSSRRANSAALAVSIASVNLFFESS